MRLAALILALAAMACSSAPPAAETADDVPFANTPGTIYAPLRSPPPSSRGVAPVILSAGTGAICGDARLIGDRPPPVVGRGRCGIKAPARVTSVAGVKLTRPITVTCETARALADWTEGSAQPAAQRLLVAKLASMRPVASYACRPRNNKRGARLSEHSFGKAVDLAGFTPHGGGEITVFRGWRGPGSRFLKAVHKGACGPFGTVLGPESDRYHQDHLHFDVARHRGGPYCR